MLYRMFALTVLLFGTVALCQQPARTTQPNVPAAPAASKPDPRLDALLLNWEMKMRAVESLTARLERKTKDVTFHTEELFIGKAMYMKPNLASLELQKKDRPDVYEKYVCTGTYLYEFVPGKKEVRVHDLPRPKPGQVGDNSFLNFLFGMKAEEAKRRYQMELAQEDKWYYCLRIFPRFPDDRQDFQKAWLVISKEDFLPRLLSFKEAQGNEVIWELKEVQVGVRLDRMLFTTPDTRGFKVIQVKDVQPRIIRPQQ